MVFEIPKPNVLHHAFFGWGEKWGKIGMGLSLLNVFHLLDDRNGSVVPSIHCLEEHHSKDALYWGQLSAFSGSRIVKIRLRTCPSLTNYTSRSIFSIKKVGDLGNRSGSYSCPREGFPHFCSKQ